MDEIGRSQSLFIWKGLCGCVARPPCFETRSSVLYSIARNIYRFMNDEAYRFQREAAAGPSDTCVTVCQEPDELDSSQSHVQPADNVALLRICGSSLLRIKRAKLKSSRN